jgi:serine/threonine protein kinase
MPLPPLSPPVQRFLQTVLRSGLLGKDALEAAVNAAPAELRADPTSLADYFVRNGTLSRFQASHLLDGVSAGLVLGPFQVLAPLGRGGMGAVYLVRDTREQRLVALKVLPPKSAEREGRLRARFLREIELSRRVAHPNLTQTCDAGVVQGVHYLAMEYIPGRSLARKVKQDGPLGVSFAARLFAEVADGLAHAHEQGLIHRDLKPSNIMVTPNGHAKVLDLGLALIEGEAPLADRKIVGGKGYVVGTMDYIAPEQIDDPLAVDARADLYALGATLYFALTGRPPFPGGTRFDKIARHQAEEPTPVAHLNSAVPAKFAGLVGRLMAKQPDWRPQSAQQVRQELLVWAAAEPAPPPDDPPGGSGLHAVLELEPVVEEPEVAELAEAAAADPGNDWAAIPFLPKSEMAAEAENSTAWKRLFRGFRSKG